MSFKVLICSAGRRGQLVECFRESAQALGIDIHVLAADAGPSLSAACSLADFSFAVPRIDHRDFIPRLLEICERKEVNLLVPTIDTELAILSEHRKEFETRGVVVAVSLPETISLARDKLQTAEVLNQAGVKTPRTLSAAQYASSPSALSWPVIVKPRHGSSSVGIARPRTMAEAVDHAVNQPSVIVQELWVGREYTVNMYFDRQGKLKCAIPHWRIETRGGEVSKGRIEDVPILRGMAQDMAVILPGARGPLCFQAIVNDDGDAAVFEINARFGGGYPLAHRAGATFSRWLLEESLGLPCTASDQWRSGITMLRYDTAVFSE